MESNPHIDREIRRLEEQYSFRPDSLVFGRLADLHRKAGNPDRALAILEEGLKRHPRYLSAHVVRARCLRALDRGERAREAFEQVLRLDGHNPVALRSLAELALERGETEQARRHLEALLQADPSDEEAHRMLSEMVDEEEPAPEDGTGEDVDELREQVEELDLSEPSPSSEGEDLATRTLAGLYEEQGFYREAVQMYERLLEEGTEAPEIRERLSRAREALEEAGGGSAAEDAPRPEPPEPERAEPDASADGPAPSAEGGTPAAPPEERRPTAAEHVRALLRGEAGREDGEAVRGARA